MHPFKHMFIKYIQIHAMFEFWLSSTVFELSAPRRDESHFPFASVGCDIDYDVRVRCGVRGKGS